jgi:ribosomal protein S6
MRPHCAQRRHSATGRWHFDGISNQLETDGGTMIKREYWGLRGFAYRIKKNCKGHYMLMGLDANPAFMHEMERQLRLNENILPFLTLSVDKLEEGPSAILLRKDDERDRNFGGQSSPPGLTAAVDAALEIGRSFAPGRFHAKTRPWIQRRAKLCSRTCDPPYAPTLRGKSASWFQHGMTQLRYQKGAFRERFCTFMIVVTCRTGQNTAELACPHT